MRYNNIKTFKQLYYYVYKLYTLTKTKQNKTKQNKTKKTKQNNLIQWTN